MDLLDPAIKSRVLEQFSKDTLKIIMETGEDRWLVADYDIELTNIVGKELSEEELIAWNKKAFERSLESSMIGPFFRTALRVFSIKPNSVLKLCPFVWKSIFRNCGELSTVEKGPGRVHLVIEEVPAVVIESRPFFLGICGSIQAILSYTKVQGKAAIQDLLKEKKRAVISITWDITTK